MRRNPALKEVYKERGMLLVDMKSYRRAILDLNEALKIEPNNSQLYFFRAIAKESAGDKEGALFDFQTSKDLENL